MKTSKRTLKKWIQTSRWVIRQHSAKAVIVSHVAINPRWRTAHKVRMFTTCMGFPSPRMFCHVLDVQIMDNRLYESLALCVHQGFPFLWEFVPFIPPFHRGRRVPGHWPESRFVTSGHGPVSCLSSTDEFRPTPDKCSMSVHSNRRVPIKQNRPMTKVQRV